MLLRLRTSRLSGQGSGTAEMMADAILKSAPCKADSVRLCWGAEPVSALQSRFLRGTRRIAALGSRRRQYGGASELRLFFRCCLDESCSRVQLLLGKYLSSCRSRRRWSSCTGAGGCTRRPARWAGPGTGSRTAPVGTPAEVDVTVRTPSPGKISHSMLASYQSRLYMFTI